MECGATLFCHFGREGEGRLVVRGAVQWDQYLFAFERRHRLIVRRSNEKYRCGAVLDNLLRDIADQHAAQVTAPMCAKHNQVGVQFCDVLDDAAGDPGLLHSMDVLFNRNARTRNACGGFVQIGLGFLSIRQMALTVDGGGGVRLDRMEKDDRGMVMLGEVDCRRQNRFGKMRAIEWYQYAL